MTVYRWSPQAFRELHILDVVALLLISMHVGIMKRMIRQGLQTQFKGVLSFLIRLMKKNCVGLFAEFKLLITDALFFLIFVQNKWGTKKHHVNMNSSSSV